MKFPQITSLLLLIATFLLLTLFSCKQNNMPTPITTVPPQTLSNFVLQVSPWENRVMTLDNYSGTWPLGLTLSPPIVDTPDINHNSLICAEMSVAPPIWQISEQFVSTDEAYGQIEEGVNLIVNGIPQENLHSRTPIFVDAVLASQKDESGHSVLTGDPTATWEIIKERGYLPPVVFCWIVPLSYGKHVAEFSFTSKTGEIYNHQWSFEIIE
jgi:hypothetical protein